MSPRRSGSPGDSSRTVATYGWTARPAAAVLRRRVAVVDAPGITEPDDALPVQTVVGEELAIAGHKAGRKAVQEWLD